MQAREREIDQIEQAPVVRRSDNAIRRIDLDPVDDAICFAITYLLDGDLSVGQLYPLFIQLSPVSLSAQLTLNLNLTLELQLIWRAQNRIKIVKRTSRILMGNGFFSRCTLLPWIRLSWRWKLWNLFLTRVGWWRF